LFCRVFYLPQPVRPGNFLQQTQNNLYAYFVKQVHEKQNLMKNLLALALTLLLTASLGKSVYAQSEENRTKIQMTVNFNGKTIVTDLSSISTSLSRSTEELPAVETTTKDTVKTKIPAYNSNAFYLTMEVKKVSDDLLNLMSKKRNLFDGMITIVDTYGKFPTRTIKFKKASLYSFSDQMSTASYGGDAYSSAAISIGCKEVSLNGIVIEQ
jgi:hypothetical protein